MKRYVPTVKTPFALKTTFAGSLVPLNILISPSIIPYNRSGHIIEQLITQNGLKDAYIRMTLSRGPTAHGLIPQHPCNPTFVVHAKPLAVYPPAWHTTGLSLKTSSFRRSDTCPVSGHKTLNFMTNYLVKKKRSTTGIMTRLS